MYILRLSKGVHCTSILIRFGEGALYPYSRWKCFTALLLRPLYIQFDIVSPPEIDMLVCITLLTVSFVILPYQNINIFKTTHHQISLKYCNCVHNIDIKIGDH